MIILSQFYWPEQIGSPAYVTDFARWIVDKVDDVMVVTGRPYYPEFRLRPGYERGQCDREVRDGVAIYRMPTYVPEGGKATKRILSEFYFFCAVVFRLFFRKIKRSDYVVSFSPSIATVLSGIFCTVAGGRHIAVIHDIQSGLAKNLGMIGSDFVIKTFMRIERHVLNHVSEIIVLTPKMKEVLQEQGVRVPIYVLPLWVDTSEFRLSACEPHSNPIVMYSGNLGRKQGIDQILDLAWILLEERPEVKVLIRGEGSEADFIRYEIQSRGLENTTLLPLIPREELSKGLSMADIHVVPQKPDTADFAIPSKIYAIMAVGRPIVATALPGSALHELQRKSKGAICCVPPYNPNIFAQEVLCLLSEPDRMIEMGREGRAYVERTSNKDDVLEDYASIILNQRRP